MKLYGLGKLLYSYLLYQNILIFYLLHYYLYICFVKWPSVRTYNKNVWLKEVRSLFKKQLKKWFCFEIQQKVLLVQSVMRVSSFVIIQQYHRIITSKECSRWNSKRWLSSFDYWTTVERGLNYDFIICFTLLVTKLLCRENWIMWHHNCGFITKLQFRHLRIF